MSSIHTIIQTLGALFVIIGTIAGIVWKVHKWYEKRKKIKAEISYGFPTYGNSVGESSVLVTAKNIGGKTTTLTSAGFLLPRDDKLILMSPKNMTRLPHKLNPNESFVVFETVQKLKEQLEDNGYEDEIKIRGFFRDEIGEEYKSDEFTFEIDSD